MPTAPKRSRPHHQEMIGPSFDRSVMPHLTARSRAGPLWVVWDTNILSMYERYGLAMWEGEEPDVRGHDPVQVTALGELVSVWMWWDIRFVVLEGTATDSKRPRPAADVAQRVTSMEGLAVALELSIDGDEPTHHHTESGGYQQT